MRLRDLEATFIKATDERTIQMDVSREEADGVEFLCPLCFAANGGPVGTHMVICWFVGRVPDDRDPKPGRWNPSGTGIDDLTFVPPGSVSVLIVGGCGWHGYVTAGTAVNC